MRGCNDTRGKVKVTSVFSVLCAVSYIYRVSDGRDRCHGLWQLVSLSVSQRPCGFQLMEHSVKIWIQTQTALRPNVKVQSLNRRELCSVTCYFCFLYGNSLDSSKKGCFYFGNTTHKRLHLCHESEKLLQITVCEQTWKNYVPSTVADVADI